MKPICARLPDVQITEHAFSRWMERANRYPRSKHKLRAMLTKAFDDELAAGAIVDNTGAVVLNMGHEVRAVLRLQGGTWYCTTFYIPW